jgi:AcrR family transcriptional regulator
MVSARERVLDAYADLVAGGDAPSLEKVAATAGVSKGGLLYHFAGTAALRDGLIARALRDTDEALRQAAAAGQAARAWLWLSVPDEGQRRLWAGLLATVRLVGSDAALPPQLREHEARWQQLLTDELGDALRAQVVRLVGDGLLLHSLSGTPPEPATVEALADHLLGGEP